MREHGQPDTPLTAVVGLVFAILLFVVVVFLQAFFYRVEREETTRKAVAVPPQELALLKAQQGEQLHSYKLLDPQHGVVAIPVEVAMGLVVRDAGRTPWPVAQPTPPPGGGG